MKAKLLAAAILGAAFCAPAHATPTLDQYGTGCPDGFCVWVKGQDLFQTTTDLNPANKYNYVYVDVYPDATSARIARYYLYQFLGTSVENGQQIFSLRFTSPTVQQAMLKGSIHFQVINPQSTSSTKWTARNLLQWKRNKVVISQNFEASPVSADSTFGIPREILKNASLAPAQNSALDWFRNAFTLESRISQESTGNRHLMARTRAGRFGPTNYNDVGGGITFTSAFCQSPPCGGDATTGPTSPGFEEAFITFRMNFANCPGSTIPYDFQRGGKIPGLMGGNGGPASGGGNNSTGPNGRNGWSARSMWGSGGVAGLYLYHPDMRNPGVIPVPPGGDPVIYHRLNEKPESLIYGHGFPYLNADGTRFTFQPNRWYMITERVKMNSVPNASSTGNFDGQIEIWVDGEQKLLVKNIRLRHGENYSVPDNQNIAKRLDIDGMNFHSFFGGGTIGHAPDTDSCVAFDDIKVFNKHQ